MDETQIADLFLLDLETMNVDEEEFSIALSAIDGWKVTKPRPPLSEVLDALTVLIAPSKSAAAQLGDPIARAAMRLAGLCPTAGATSPDATTSSANAGPTTNPGATTTTTNAAPSTNTPLTATAGSATLTLTPVHTPASPALSTPGPIRVTLGRDHTPVPVDRDHALQISEYCNRATAALVQAEDFYRQARDQFGDADPDVVRIKTYVDAARAFRRAALGEYTKEERTRGTGHPAVACKLADGAVDQARAAKNALLSKQAP